MGYSLSIVVDIGVDMSIGGPLGIGIVVAAAAVAAAVCVSLHRTTVTSAHRPRGSRGAMLQLPQGCMHFA